MTDSALVRRIEITGWSTVVLGLVCVALAAIQVMMPILLSRMAEVFDTGDDPTLALREAWSAGAGISAVVNGSFGVALIVIGIAVGRRAHWAHAALTASGWASIAVLAVLAKPTLAPLFAMAGSDTRTVSGGMLAASAVLLLAQIGAVLWFLRFWRKPEVRAAFR